MGEYREDESKLVLEGELVEKLSKTLERLEALNPLLEKLVWMRENGVLDDLLNVLAELVIVQRGVVNEEFVREVSTLLALIAPLMTSECLDEYSKSFREEGKIGVLKLLSSLRDPDIQRGLAIVLGFLRSLGRCFKSASTT